MVFQESLRVFEFSRVVSRKLQVYFKKDSGKFDGCFKKVSNEDGRQGSFNGVSRKFPRLVKEVSSLFQEIFMKVLREFQGRLKSVSRAFSVGSKGF